MSVQAILPVLIGEFDGTKFKDFPFEVVDQLPDVPSQVPEREFFIDNLLVRIHLSSR